jgi:hypothetical protein
MNRGRPTSSSDNDQSSVESVHDRDAGQLDKPRDSQPDRRHAVHESDRPAPRRDARPTSPRSHAPRQVGSSDPQERLPPASPDRYDGKATKVSHPHPNQVRSTRGALPVLLLVGFPVSPPEPGVHLTAHRALHRPRWVAVHLMWCSAIVSGSVLLGSSSA